jgi:RecA/RadA recombinase
MAQAAALQALRAKIHALESGARIREERVITGVSQLDALIGGLPRPGIVEICGDFGSGRTQLALAIVAARIRKQEPVAWVDWRERFHPFGLSEAELRALLILQPPVQQGEWATEQLLRSGCFPVVVVADPKGLKRTVRWKLAAEQGHSSLVLLGRRPNQRIPVDIRLSLSNRQMLVIRNRGARPGRQAALPMGGFPWA